MAHQNREYRMGRGAGFLFGASGLLLGLTGLLFGADMLDGTFGDIVPLEDHEGNRVVTDIWSDGRKPLALLIGSTFTAGGLVTAVAGGYLIKRSVS